MSHDDHLHQLAEELEQLRVGLDELHNSALLGQSPPAGLVETARARTGAMRALLRAAQREFATLSNDREKAQRDAWENRGRRAEATARLNHRERLLQQIENSGVWKTVKPLWKLFRRSGKAVLAGKAQDDLLFAIELPAQWKTNREVLLIKGWCLSSSGGEIAGVRAKINRKGRLARYGLSRRDVAENFGHLPAAAHSGFTIEIRLPRGKSQIRLETIEQGSDWQLFFEHEIEREGDDPGPAASEAEGKLQTQAVFRFPSVKGDKMASLFGPQFRQHDQALGNAKPFFSILTPAYNTKPQWLAEAAASLLHQTFADWEWCIVDDGSPDRATRRMLEQLQGLSSRVQIKFCENGGISSATNEALDLAAGRFVCFMDHDDLLAPEALELMAAKLQGDFDVIYSDEDKLDDKTGELVEPFFKPDWSPEYLRGVMYVGHFLCVRCELAATVRFDKTFDGVQDFEFMLRVGETGANIGHIPTVLYHWRKTPGSIAEKADAKPEAALLQQKAVNAHLQRLGLPAHAEASALPHRLRSIPTPRTSVPKVSVIIPTKNSPGLLRRCLESIYDLTSYRDFEVILMDNETTDPDALALMRQHPVRRIPLPNPFNFSRANNLATREASGSFLVSLNNDTEIVTKDWLQHLLYYSEQPDVGAVGALLLYENRSVQHAGVALGMRGTADHVMRGFPAGVDGYAGNLACAREVSAVTAACMMMRKTDFEDIGGFNEHYFTIYQDLDLCLRLRERGRRIIYAPQAVVIHHESVSRKSYYDMVDRMLLLDQWEAVIEQGDPYYNPNLNLERGDCSARK